MAHKCSHPGCGFHLPDTYPLPLCPWHATPGKGIPKILAAASMFAIGVGGMYLYQKVADLAKHRKTKAEQDKWREQGENLRKNQEPPLNEDRAIVRA